MEKNVRILIVEDEFVTLDLLRSYLIESGYEVSGDAMSAVEAIEILDKGETDFVMLDINIQGAKNGIWIAEQINHIYKIPFVFLTALSDSDSVKTAISTKPYGYLVKPFKKEDIFTTIEIALSNYSENRISIPSTESEQKRSDIQIHDAIFIKNGDIFKKIFIKDIQYIEAFKNYLELHFADSRQVIRSTLTDLIKALPQDHFFQSHRSFVVNINFIESVGVDFVVIGKTEIPVSRSFKENVLNKLKFYK